MGKNRDEFTAAGKAADKAQAQMHAVSGGATRDAYEKAESEFMAAQQVCNEAFDKYLSDPEG